MKTLERARKKHESCRQLKANMHAAQQRLEGLDRADKKAESNSWCIRIDFAGRTPKVGYDTIAQRPNIVHTQLRSWG